MAKIKLTHKSRTSFRFNPKLSFTKTSVAQSTGYSVYPRYFSTEFLGQLGPCRSQLSQPSAQSLLSYAHLSCCTLLCSRATRLPLSPPYAGAAALWKQSSNDLIN